VVASADVSKNHIPMDRFGVPQEIASVVELLEMSLCIIGGSKNLLMIHANNRGRQKLGAANIPKSYSCKDNNSSGVGGSIVVSLVITASAVHRNWKHVGRRLNQ